MKKVTISNWTEFYACHKCACYHVCEIANALRNRTVVISHCLYFKPNDDVSEKKQVEWKKQHSIFWRDEDHEEERN